MAGLVADVGGTNARLGLCKNGQLDASSVKRFANVDFATFYDTIAAYLTEIGNPKISNAVVALAGPISGCEGRLTNRNWVITTKGLKEAANCDEAILMNDLSSLGYSVKELPEDGVSIISPGASPDHSNAQCLIIGIGTGFNVCPVKRDEDGTPTCHQAEAGHIALPGSVLAVTEHKLDDAFKTVEDLFSGRGLSRLYQDISDGEHVDGQIIVERYTSGTDPHATKTMQIYAKMLGLLTRELVLSYMPLGGINFAGSVARGLFDAGLAPEFCKSFHARGHFLPTIRDIPVRLIKDDAAGLIGCSVAGKMS